MRVTPMIAAGMVYAALAGAQGAAPGGTIRSGSEVDYPPFCIVHEDGRADGFSVELLRAALAKMGREVTFRTGPWDEVRGWLERGEIDALPLVGRTPEREALFDFTVPYLTMHGAIVVREKTTDVNTLGDLHGRRVGVMKGDNAEEFLRREDRDFEIVSLPTFTEALHALNEGRCDAVVVQRLVAIRLLAETGLDRLRIVDRPIHDFSQAFCFAVKAGDRETLAILNEGLALAVADGTHRRLHAKWFAALELPSNRPIVIGGDHNYPPFEFLDEKGRPAGYNVDLIRAIADATGLDIRIRLGEWTATMSALERGEIDAIMGMLYSSERDETFDFSQAHLVNHGVAVTRKEDGPPPSALADLSGKRIVVQDGDIMHEFCRRNGLTNRLAIVGSQEQALRELAAGKHDCALVARVAAYYWIERKGWDRLAVGRTPFVSPDYGFAVPKGQRALLAQLSEGLTAIAHSGEYKRIQEKWIGVYEEHIHWRNALKVVAWVASPLLLITLLALLWSWGLRKQVARRTTELQEKESLLSLSQEIAHTGSWKLDLTTNRLTWSDEVYRIFGCKPQGFAPSYEAFLDFSHPEDRAAVDEAYSRSVREGNDSYEIEHRIVRRNADEVRYVHERCVHERDASGAIVQSTGMIQDITERKQAEEALNHSEQLMRFVIEHSNSGVAIHDRNLNYLYVSQQYLDMYNVRDEKIIGKHHYEIFPDLPQKWREVHQKALAGEVSRSDRDPYERSDGTIEWTRWECRPWFEKDGAIGGIIVYTEIITEHVKAEEQLRFQADIIDNSPIIAAYHDAELNVVWVNKAYQKATGLSLEEVRGRKCYQVWNLSKPCRDCPVITAIETGERASHELTPDNQDNWPETQGCWLSLVSPVRDSQDNVIGALEFAIDITERKRAEEALRASEENLRITLNSIGDAVITTDVDGRVVSMNPVAEALTGWAGNEAVRQQLDDIFRIINEQTRQTVESPVENVLKTGQIVGLANHTLLIAKDGRETPIADSGAPIKSAAGETTGVVLVFRDQSAERAARCALEASEEKLRSIFASMTEIVVLHELVCDEDGRPVNYRILDCNPAFTQITGIRHEDAVGRLATDVYSSDTAPYLDEYARVTMTGEPCTFITSYAPMDKHFDVHATSPGKNRFITVTTDITERKQTETYLEMGQDILEILNERGDLQDSIQRILTVLKTRTGCDAVGLRLQEGEDFPYFAHDGLSKEFLLTENTLVERGKEGGVCRDKDGNVCLECTCGLVISGNTDPASPLFTQGGSCWTNDSFPLLDLPSDQDPRRHPRNNCIHQGYASVALIPVRTKDRIVGLIQLNDKRKGRFSLGMIEILEGIAAHIGSALMRKRAESELRRLSTAIEQSPETVVITDTEGTIQYVNPAFETITGYTCEEAMGQNPRMLKSGRHDADFYTAMWKTLLDGRVWEGRVINKRKDGSLYTEDASIAPVKDPNGTITNYVGVKRDITAELEREDMLRQAQKMDSVGRLAGGVAHDFNNLLMGIMGYADLCREELPEKHPVREWLDEITREAQRSANLTRQLLAFARKQTVAPQVVDLNDAVGNMLKMLRRLISEDIDLSWQPGAAPWSVKIDPGQVDQILANLCINARDAIGSAGKVTIETENMSIGADYCKEHIEAAPGSYVMLAVSDDGCGMDHETLGKVFEPFFTTKPTGEGTGLGLATVYGIVKQNNGFVNVYSEPGKGTTFRMYLPRDTSERKAATEAETTTASQGGTETILLVEDETAIRFTMRLFLERFGYTVIAAESPDEALRLVAEHRDGIDLLLTDVIMPGMSGRELAGKLAVDFPTMKILYMSGYTANVIAHRGILDDGVQFISKPIGRDALVQKVREVLG